MSESDSELCSLFHDGARRWLKEAGCRTCAITRPVTVAVSEARDALVSFGAARCQRCAWLSTKASVITERQRDRDAATIVAAKVYGV